MFLLLCKLLTPLLRSPRCQRQLHHIAAGPLLHTNNVGPIMHPMLSQKKCRNLDLAGLGSLLISPELDVQLDPWQDPPAQLRWL